MRTGPAPRRYSTVSYTHLQQGRVNAVMVQSLDRLSHDITTLYRILRFLPVSYTHLDVYKRQGYPYLY